MVSQLITSFHSILMMDSCVAYAYAYAYGYGDRYGYGSVELDVYHVAWAPAYNVVADVVDVRLRLQIHF